jgi:glycerol kinase
MNYKLDQVKGVGKLFRVVTLAIESVCLMRRALCFAGITNQRETACVWSKSKGEGICNGMWISDLTTPHTRI